MSKKKVNTDSLVTKLPLAMKTGKYEIGFKRAIRLLRNKETKCLVFSKNFPALKRKMLEYYAALANDVPIAIFNGNNNEMAKMCDQRYRIGVISILNEGESDLLDFVN